MKERIIIQPHAGGTGDNMLYGTLPQLYHDRAYVAGSQIEVLIRNFPPKRNQQAYDLIWGTNPYVDGYTDDPPNAGVYAIVNDFIGEAKRWRSPIAAVEYLHGFDPVNRVPKLYYKPQHRADVAEKVLFSPRSISARFGLGALAEFAREVCRWHGYDFEQLVILESKFDGPNGAGVMPTHKRYMVGDYFEKTDMIASCRAFLSTESGDQSIAAAVRGERETHVLCSPWTFNDKIFIYDGPIYRVTREFSMPGDYHPYPDANRPVGKWGEVTLA